MWNLVIVDDEPLIAEGLAEMIRSLGTQYRICGVFDNALDAEEYLLNAENEVDLLISDTVSGSFGFLSPIQGIKICFLNGRKELPNQIFLFYFLYAATVGERGVCVAQTCARMRGQPATSHTAARRAPRRGANGCADERFVVQPSTFRPEAALGSGFSLQAAFWYQNAMLALFLRSKKSLRYSPSLESHRKQFQFFLSYRT